MSLSSLHIFTSHIIHTYVHVHRNSIYHLKPTRPIPQYHTQLMVRWARLRYLEDCETSPKGCNTCTPYSGSCIWTSGQSTTFHTYSTYMHMIITKMHTHIHTIIIHTYLQTNIHIGILRRYIHTYTHNHHTYIFTNKHTYRNVTEIHTHIYTQSSYKHTYIHTYSTWILRRCIHTYTRNHHTYIHIYIHTYIHTWAIYTSIHTYIHYDFIHLNYLYCGCFLNSVLKALWSLPAANGSFADLDSASLSCKVCSH